MDEEADVLARASKLRPSEFAEALVVLDREAYAEHLLLCGFLPGHILSGKLPHMSPNVSTKRQDLSSRFRLVSVRSVERKMRDYLGDAIRARRDQLGLTQPQLAERIGCEKRTISRWENGGKQDSDGKAFARLEEIAPALETTPAKLLSMALGLAGYRQEAQPTSDDLTDVLTELVAGSAEMKAQLAAMQIELEEIGTTVKRSE